MKGLLYKDLHLFPRTYKVQIAISLIFFAGFFFWERQVSLLATAVMMLAVSVLAYLYADEAGGWQKYCHTTPVIRSRYVLSRYLFLVPVTAGMLLVLGLMMGLSALIFEPFEAQIILFYLGMMTACLLVPLAVVFPFAFGFGIGERFIVYELFAAVIYGGVVGLSVTLSWKVFAGREGLLGLILFGVALVLTLVSMLISASLYQKRKTI